MDLEGKASHIIASMPSHNQDVDSDTPNVIETKNRFLLLTTSQIFQHLSFLALCFICGHLTRGIICPEHILMGILQIACFFYLKRAMRSACVPNASRGARLEVVRLQVKYEGLSIIIALFLLVANAKVVQDGFDGFCVALNISLDASSDVISFLPAGLSCLFLCLALICQSLEFWMVIKRVSFGQTYWNTFSRVIKWVRDGFILVALVFPFYWILFNIRPNCIANRIGGACANITIELSVMKNNILFQPDADCSSVNILSGIGLVVFLICFCVQSCHTLWQW